MNNIITQCFWPPANLWPCPDPTSQ